MNRRAGLKLVDPNLYNPVQPHYLAAPVLDGIPDPLPRRSGFRRGLSDTVEIVAPSPLRLVAAGDGAGLKPAHGFENYLAEIGGEHGFHNSIFRAICATSAPAASRAPTPWRCASGCARRSSPPRRGTAARAEIERYASARYLDDEIRRRPRPQGAEEERQAREIRQVIFAFLAKKASAATGKGDSVRRTGRQGRRDRPRAALPGRGVGPADEAGAKLRGWSPRLWPGVRVGTA